MRWPLACLESHQLGQVDRSVEDMVAVQLSLMLCLAQILDAEAVATMGKACADLTSQRLCQACGRYQVSLDMVLMLIRRASTSSLGHPLCIRYVERWRGHHQGRRSLVSWRSG